MKRKIVKHGPSTLTISLPAKWIREHGIAKGDEVDIKHMNHGLFLSTPNGLKLQQRAVSVKKLQPSTTAIVISALYTRGYDEILMEHGLQADASAIHWLLENGCIGFEIIGETEERIRVKKVTEPSETEFKTLFRRIFYFLLSIAEEGIDAARNHDTVAYSRLAARDQHVNRLADFCKRVVNKRGQKDYSNDILLYSIIDQLEKIGDTYKAVNCALQKRKSALPPSIIELYASANGLLKMYEHLFFRFTLERVDEFVQACDELSAIAWEGDTEIMHLLRVAGLQIRNLVDTTVSLHL